MATPPNPGHRKRNGWLLLAAAALAGAVFAALAGRDAARAAEAQKASARAAVPQVSPSPAPAPASGPAPAAEELVPMPEFKLASLGGASFSRADFANKVVLYDFWATWCGPCHLQADILRELYPQAAKRGFEFVAVDTGEEVTLVREFVAKKPLPFAVLVDPDETIASHLDIVGLPTLLIVDRHGRISHRLTGVANAEALLDYLEAAARN